jgi:hypothetical protein
MSDVQLAVIDGSQTSLALSAPSETFVTIAVPGVQGPAGIAASAITVTGATYALSSINNNRLALFTAASGAVVTIPLGLSDGFNCLAVQTTASGQVTISGASGVTVRSALSASKTVYQWAVASIIKIGTEEYLLTGEVTA